MAKYTITDAQDQAFTVVPVAYTIGADTRATLGKKAWPLITDTLPIDAEHFKVYATQDCWIAFLPVALILGQALGIYTAGLPEYHFVPSGVQMEFDAPACMVYVVRDAVDGNLYISAFA